jgi:two-component system invasion response regulator UvrY
MPSVLIVDDYLLVRQGLKQMLSQEYRSLVLGEAKTSDEATVRLARQPWDLVILDIAISGNDGFHVLQEILRCHPSTRVLVLSMHADSEDAVRAQQLGASGYVGKNASRADLVRAFKSVLSGKKYFEDHISPGTGVKTVPRHADLSTRESAVMLAFADGKRTSEIAAELNLGVKTISSYRRRLCDKLGLHSTAELVHYVIDHKLS